MMVSANVDMMLIVGEVTGNSARVLYEASNSPSDLPIHVKLFKNDVLVSEHGIVGIQRPKVLKFDNLHTDTHYKAEFNSEIIQFRTIANTPLKIVTLSCDRYVDDNDEEFWKTLVTKDSDFDLAIHMGDQIYGDVIGKNSQGKSYETLLEEYRGLYRKTFNTQLKSEFLRRGSHVMLPDDHDITNNLDSDSLNPDLNPVVKAGRQAYYEYQYQLHDDYLDESGNYNPIYYFKRIGKIAFAFLDTRFERTFNFDNSSRLLGKKQFEQLSFHLNEWKDVENWFVVTSVPLGFFTKTMAEIAYSLENPKERYPSQSFLLPSLLELLDLLKNVKNVNLISGDVHQFVRSTVCHVDGTCLKQLITSGMSKGSSVISEFKLLSFFAFGRHFTGQKIGNWTLSTIEQFLDNNYGVIIVESDGKFEWKGMFREAHGFELYVKNKFFEYFPIVVFIIMAMMAILVKGYFTIKPRSPE